MNGKVWLVGAGPGDPELLTLKGRRVLEEADVVVCDRLIGPAVLNWARPEAERIDVGKRGGCHPVPQREIEKILIEKAREGKKVVRLKGGDPFLFGRGAEEMAALTERGIPCELVPGVTSALAVPAYAGIPVTHRDCASSLHIITAHKREDSPEDVDYETLARLDGTLVFLMGASKLGEICARLTAAGMDKETPAAVVENGTTARQRQVFGVLDDLQERAEAAKIKSPAVIVVGRAAALGGILDWRASLPLAGKRVLVPLVQKEGRLTKNAKKRLAGLLCSRGAEAVELPVSRTEAVDIPLPALGGYSWLVFTSAEGVDKFFERLRTEGRDVREIGDAKIAAVGPATERAVELRGLRAALIPAVSSGAALAEALCSVRQVQPARQERLLLLRAENGAPELTKILRENGLTFDEIPVYRTVPITETKIPEGVGLEGIDMEDIDAVAFTCASSVRNFAALYRNSGAKLKAACIGEQTAKAAREAGYETYTAKKATLEDLADVVEYALKNGEK